MPQGVTARQYELQGHILNQAEMQKLLLQLFHHIPTCNNHGQLRIWISASGL
jgi:hypothetical protein